MAMHFTPRASAPLTTASERPGAARVHSPVRDAPAFAWSRKLVTLAGIDVYVHGTFFILIAFLAMADVVAGKGLAAIARGVLLIVAVFTTVVLHELGHALTARRFGIRTRDITLLPIGGIARLERMPETPIEQLLMSAAGPAVNVVIALFLFGALILLDGPVGFQGMSHIGGSFLTQLMWINVSLAVFNLLPAFPMDGGRILRALLAMRMAPERATQVAARVGQGFAVLLAVVGLLVKPFLMVIAAFVWLGARAEHSASTAKVALNGLTVRQAMITDFKTVSPTDTLSRAVELTLAGFQQDFPVMDGASLVGVLTYGDMLKGIAEGGTDRSVEGAMRGELASIHPSEALDGALIRLQGERRVMTVVENEKLVGLLTVVNIGELMALGAAGRMNAGLAS